MWKVEKVTKSRRYQWHNHLSIRKYKNDENGKIHRKSYIIIVLNEIYKWIWDWN